MADSYLTILTVLTGADAPSDGDNGFGFDDIDDSLIFAVLTGSDTGTGTDASAFALTDDDTGTGTDAGSIVHSDSDTGTGTETGSFVISSSDSNTTVTELGVVGLVSYTGSDTGTADEEAGVLDLNTMLPTGILSQNWFGDIENKWTATATRRWTGRLIDSVDQIG